MLLAMSGPDVRLVSVDLALMPRMRHRRILRARSCFAVEPASSLGSLLSSMTRTGGEVFFKCRTAFLKVSLEASEALLREGPATTVLLCFLQRSPSQCSRGAFLSAEPTDVQTWPPEQATLLLAFTQFRVTGELLWFFIPHAVLVCKARRPAVFIDLLFLHRKLPQHDAVPGLFSLLNLLLSNLNSAAVWSSFLLPGPCCVARISWSDNVCSLSLLR